MSITKSESVWLEEVDKGLVEYLSKILVIPTKTTVAENGNLKEVVEDKQVPVRPRKPDENFLEEHYPIVTFFCMQIKDGWERQDHGVRMVRIEPDSHIGIAEKVSKSMNLFYQIDFWSNKVSDMNTMLRKFFYNCSKEFVLPVKDVSGNQRYCQCVATQGLRTVDFVNSESEYIRKLLHRVITYKIYVELDEKEQEEVNIVSSIKSVVEED